MTANAAIVVDTCPDCHLWQVADDDTYCGYCGNLLLPLTVTPSAVILIPGSARTGSRRLLFSNTGQEPFTVTLRPLTTPAPGVAFLPDEPVTVAPGEKATLKVGLDAERLPDGFKQAATTYLCVVDGDANKTLPITITVKAGPRPRLATPELHFGRLEEGTSARRALRLHNRGGVPLRVKSIEVEGSSQLRLDQGTTLPALVEPDQELTVPVVWDTAREETDPTAARTGLLLTFENHADTLFVPARSQLFRRIVTVAPERIEVPKALSGHEIVRKVRLENLGTVDVRIDAIAADQDWLEVVGRHPRFHLRCRTVAGASAADTPADDLPVLTGGYDFEILCRPADLASGSHRGTVTIHTADGQAPPVVSVELEVIRPEVYHDYIGIDFGTTNSVLAILDRNEELELVTVRDQKGEPSPLIPSILVFHSGLDSYSIGWQARNEVDTAADRAVRSVKRLLGSRNQHQYFGHALSADQIAARIIRRLLQMAERHLFETQGTYVDIDKAIVTVPANFFDAQIRGVLKACAEAGIDTEQESAMEAAAAIKESLGAEVNAGIILDEPSAAALFYLDHLERHGGGAVLKQKIKRKKGMHLLVFDYGGGTLDVSITHITRLESGQSALTVLANDGDNRIGGDSIDLALMKALVERCNERFPRAFDPSLILDGFADLLRRRDREGWSTTAWTEVLAVRNHWKDAAENAKLALTDAGEATVEIAGLDIVRFDGGKVVHHQESFETALTRHQLEDLIKPTLAQSEQLVRRALALAGVKQLDIDFIFHTGRQSLMPAVRRRIKALFPKLPDDRDLLDPDHLKVCVAKGAARYGALRNGLGAGGVRFLNHGRRLPHSYGVAKSTGLTQLRFEEVIAHGTPYPVEKTITFEPDEIAGGRHLRLRIYQNRGTGDQIAGNPDIQLLGQLHLDTLADGKPGCDVRFTVDANRTLEVSADGQEVTLEPEAWEEEDGWMW